MVRCANQPELATFNHTLGNGGHGYKISVTLLSAFGFQEGSEFVAFSYGDQVSLPSMCT